MGRAALFMVFLCILASNAGAQIRIVPREKLMSVAAPRLSADSASLCFGTRHIVAPPMNEDDAPVTFRFGFCNIGDIPVRILRVTSTCSCASAVCPKGMLAPGDSSEILLTYAPKGHPGRFERKVFVYTMEGNAPAAVLKLSVDVAAGKDVSGLWPVSMGKIRLRTSEVAVDAKRPSVGTLRFLNVSGGPLDLKFEEAFLPAGLSVRCEPSVVGEGQEGVIMIICDPSYGIHAGTVKVILKNMGLPPSRSTIKVNIR